MCIARAEADFFIQEAQERQIDLPEQHPAAVEALIQLVYEGGYDPKDIIGFHPELSLTMFQVHVFAIANYCEFPELKEVACAAIVVLGDEICRDESICEAIRHTYDMVADRDDRLRSTFADITVKSTDELLETSP